MSSGLSVLIAKVFQHLQFSSPYRYKSIIFVAFVLIITTMLSKSLLSRQVLRHQAPVRMSTAAASYPDLIRQLYKINMYNQVKLGLDNMIALNDKLGSPMTGIPIVHITGTNGKGSVAYKIARSLSNSGLRTGLFVSPHIASFKERVQVDNQLLTDEDVQVLQSI